MPSDHVRCATIEPRTPPVTRRWAPVSRPRQAAAKVSSATPDSRVDAAYSTVDPARFQRRGSAAYTAPRKDTESNRTNSFYADIAVVFEKNTIAKTIDKQNAQVGCCFYLMVLQVGLGITAAKHHRNSTTFVQQSMEKCTLLAYTIRVRCG